ncbi:winged helix-turn-helix transcriptional regulator [Acetobacter nitrogenifigens]|uniref:winged helix-turn-helix transcriptional regulator n=1 Tax=Acetobacter nitrogenifigens TaxID=285268 RepID=UPI0003F57146|nr:helix-turn-helix domain-containing protein [Acetobacter nitrogenifigens]
MSEQSISPRPLTKDETVRAGAAGSCNQHEVLTRLGDKWTIMVMLQLAAVPGQRMRFSALKRKVAGISQRMLTVTLRMLERNGLVIRHYFAEVPLRVEYELSPLGHSLVPMLENFSAWIAANWQDMEDARLQHDREA